MVLLGAIDQGTSSSRFLIFESETGQLLASHQIEVCQQFPEPGYVEMCPIEIFETTVACIAGACENLKIKHGIGPENICAIGITNQRETTVVWDKLTGKPLYNAIVWLDSRTHELANKFMLKIDRSLDLSSSSAKRFCQNHFKGKTGLPIHPYFTALKLRWLLDNVPDVQESLSKGNLMVGTVDTWLIWKLLGIYITDVTNASRTLLMDIHERQWSPELCEFFEIPIDILPEIRSSAEIYGNMREGPLKGKPISGCLGDQQSALLGHGCLQAGEAKNTYGTGTFMLCNTGKRALVSSYGLLTTIAYQFGLNSPAFYALEGSGSIGGNVVRFLRDNLQFFEKTSEIEQLASTVENTEDVYFVPCFAGLYTPQWDPTARGIICGLTQSATRAHISLAALKAVAFQTVEMLEAIEKDMNDIRIECLKADGGMTQNKLFNKLQANSMGIPLECSKMAEISGWGAALAGGIGIGEIDYQNLGEVLKQRRPLSMDKYEPTLEENERKNEYKQWLEAVKRSKGWAHV
ncbi:hypothetical protein Mgra_00003030 [Meloidogyne graminicola]|uniref:Probable glycerol kinase n=1 Tax=Meloidogyne graminicola TaxID=189291 RepID=A0A8S9ZWS6_9BILA|nr:hypothetical protein Mgra_00003030 [Meloidogyne graminicola]